MLATQKPREQNGRDSFSRYKAQIRSAAIACLSILEGQNVDRVYCDLHDDFVVRVKNSDSYSYIFYQVKTKGKVNHNWKLNEVFGLKATAKKPESHDSIKISDSFVGKLLLHTVNFDDYCNRIVFQTNVHIGDEIDKLLTDIEKKEFSNKFVKVIIDRFNECFGHESDEIFSIDEIKDKLSKLKFETDVQYLKEGGDDFEPLAREKIYKFSEVDLTREDTKEILLKLIDLVEKKSSGVISDFNQESIEQEAGISIDDLLSILSISKDAYLALLEGGDPKAIKSISIIQRALSNSGAGQAQVEYCSRCKTEWDVWVRNNRHSTSELDLNIIFSGIKQVLSSSLVNGAVSLRSLKAPIEALLVDLKDDEIIFDLNENIIIGGVFSELVKGKA